MSWLGEKYEGIAPMYQDVIRKQYNASLSPTFSVLMEGRNETGIDTGAGHENLQLFSGIGLGKHKEA